MSASIARAAVAGVWLQQGLWRKVLSHGHSQHEILASVPVLGRRPAAALRIIGLGEAALAIWVLWGRRPRAAAATQTGLIAVMNAGGLLFGRDAIDDPSGMVVTNAVLLTLAWTAAGEPAR